MSNPLDMTQDDVQPGVDDEGRIRMAVNHIDATTGHWSEKACAYLTPEEARRLSDLLLAVAAEGAPK